MFNVNEPAECVGFDSQWKIKKVTVQDSVQTLPITTETASFTTSTSASAEIQTEVVEVKTPEYDEQKLADFLKRLYPKVSKELNEAANSQVFNNYHADAPSTRTPSKLIKSLKLTPESGDFNKSVSCLSWNATGKKLAISVMQEHETWCHHFGIIFIYSFHSSNEDENGRMMRIKMPNCITSISYHPTMPPILAVGTYTGEVMIVNTQNDENEQLLVKKVGHDNLITQLAWVDDLDAEKMFILATASLDGCLNMWDLNLSTAELKLKEKYKIKTPLFGRLQRASEIPMSISKKVDRGIVCFDFSRHSPEKFIVAAEGGLIAQCSRLGTKELTGSSKELLVSDPVYKYYRSHEGEITSIALSPDRPDLFATNGSDGEIRVYDVGEEEPGNVIRTKDDTVYVAWVPYSQNLLTACGSSGTVDFYNARNGKLLMNMNDAQHDGKRVDDVSSTCLAFHQTRISVVALGTKDGTVQIWDIPWNNF